MPLYRETQGVSFFAETGLFAVFGAVAGAAIWPPLRGLNPLCLCLAPLAALPTPDSRQLRLPTPEPELRAPQPKAGVDSLGLEEERENPALAFCP